MIAIVYKQHGHHHAFIMLFLKLVIYTVELACYVRLIVTVGGPRLACACSVTSNMHEPIDSV